MFYIFEKKPYLFHFKWDVLSLHGRFAIHYERSGLKGSLEISNRDWDETWKLS